MSDYISTQKDLDALIELLEGSKILCIDTEFLREETYYPKLCLVQINNGQICAIIDPLNLDLTPFGKLLADNSITKIFHAGSQDIEILYHETNVVPRPIFDTQVAAALLGYPLQVGYGPLVRSMCQVKLNKSDTYTDWARRPLTKTQLIYALDDVRYLPEIYEIMLDQLTKNGRLAWLESDFEEMSNPRHYETEPREMWRKVKRVSSLSRAQLAIAREVASWREITARKNNMPRKWILPDEAIVNIARKAPNTRERLLEVRETEKLLGVRDIDDILEAVRLGLQTPQSQLPRIKKHGRGDKAITGTLDLMVALVNLRAEQNNVAAPVLASHDELKSLAHGHVDDSPILQGWRREMIGEELLELLDGKLSLHIEKGAIKVARRK